MTSMSNGGQVARVGKQLPIPNDHRRVAPGPVCKSHGPKESGILGENLVALWGTIMHPADVILSSRISRLASPQLARPLLNLGPETGAPNSHMRSVTLAEFGEAVLAGQPILQSHLLVSIHAATAGGNSGATVVQFLL